MEFQELISRLALTLGIGLLFGLERGWRTREDRPGGRAAGIRTFAITGVLGGVVGVIAQALGGAGGGIAVALAFAVYGGAMAVFCLEENRDAQSFSATTWVAAMLTLALGIYAVMGDVHAAAALAVGSTIILALREPLHGWVERLTWPELRSALVLLAMTFIALPIVPDDPVGPFGGVNPREVWLIAIVLAGVSFVGYAAVKYLGARRGVLLAGLAGGLASSTAVTITNARHAALGEGSPRLLAAGVAVSSAVMFVRVGAIAAAINARLAAELAVPLLAAAAAALAYAVAAVYWRRSGDDASRQLSFRNPFAFWSVLGFALFLGAVIVIGRVLGERLGAAGAIVGAAVVGLVDVDAITVSLSQLAPATLFPRDAGLAVLAAVAANMVSKVAIGGAFGSRNFVLEVVIMSAGCLLAAGAAWWAMLAIMAP